MLPHLYMVHDYSLRKLKSLLNVPIFFLLLIFINFIVVALNMDDKPQSMRNTIQQHHFNVSLKAFIEPFCNETKLEQLSNGNDDENDHNTNSNISNKSNRKMAQGALKTTLFFSLELFLSLIHSEFVHIIFAEQ